MHHINARSSAEIGGRPPGARVPALEAAKPFTMPAHERIGKNDGYLLEDLGKPAIELEEEQTIAVAKLDAAFHPNDDGPAAGARHSRPQAGSWIRRARTTG
jgi:hypothetical protein